VHELWAQQLDEHLASAQALRGLLPSVGDLADKLCAAFAAGGVLYTFGNGGSAADAQHLVAELVGRYRRDRRPLPAVALTTDPSVITCIGNDYAFESIFARQVTALARPGDMVLAFSTSGTSSNVVAGLQAAADRGAMTVLLCGKGAATVGADVVFAVPATSTARIQEMHLLVLHLLSEHVDSWAADQPLRPWVATPSMK
jgi:D-sedoheptulose 7-phosphate isomerase